MKTSLRIPYQFSTAAMGALLLLPLQSLSLPLLLTLPGLAFFLLCRGAKHTDLLETIAYSLSLSLILVPAAATIVYFLGVSLVATGAALGLAIIATSALSLAVQKEKAIPRKVAGAADKRRRKFLCALPILLAFALALIVSVPLSKSFVVGDEGLMMNPTEASDTNFHLSILARFAESPHIPPEDPYLPSHYVVYDFFTHVYVGTLATLTGISTLTIFKITIPFLLFALSVNIYVLCCKTFNTATALVAMILYTLGGGLAWIAIVAQRPTDVFPYLIYHFADAAAIKYDQTLLFYLLPQPQAFALVILVFAFILWTALIKKPNMPRALLFGLTLGVLPYYHLITAFPLLAAVAVDVVYQYAKGRVVRAQYHLGALAVGAAIASPLLFLTAAGPNQVEIALSTYSICFMLIVYGLIGILAFIGAYGSLTNKAAKPLLIFAVCAFIAVNVVSLPLTDNSYRFLVYLWLPIALFASYCISTVIAKANGERFWSKRRTFKIAAVIAAVLLALPTSYALWSFYDTDTYVHASPDELQAAQWIKTNTAKDAIFFEEPSTFPRIPFTTGRMVAFAGAIYTIQYHGINLQKQTDALMNERSPALLDLGLRQLNVSYIFIGPRERGYAIAITVNNSSYFERVYSNPTVNIYKLKE